MILTVAREGRELWTDLIGIGDAIHELVELEIRKIEETVVDDFGARDDGKFDTILFHELLQLDDDGLDITPLVLVGAMVRLELGSVTKGHTIPDHEVMETELIHERGVRAELS